MKTRVMKKTVLFLLLGCGVSLPVLAGVTVRQVEESFPLGVEETLRVDIPVAEVEIRGGGGEEVSVEMVIACKRRTRGCEEDAERLRLEVDRRAASVKLSVDGYPRGTDRAPDIELKIRMPASRAVDLELGVGSVEISGMEADLRLDVGVGSAEVEMPKSAVRSVHLDAGVGDVEMRPEPDDARTSGFMVGHELGWDGGPGEAQVRIEVGVGDAELVLR